MFSGKVALITGGGSGIGRAAALAFGQEKARIVVADISAEGGKETVKLVKETGGEAIFVETNVSVARQVEQMVNTAVKHFGRLDFAFNNAGIGRGTTITDTSEEDWDLVMEVNIKGVWLCMKYEIPQMLRQGSGVIVNTVSPAGMKALDVTNPPYSASKAGVINLTKLAAFTYAKQGIRVNAVMPGFTDTPMLSVMTSEQKALFAARYVPMGRLSKPEEIAAPAVWLCSEAASFVTGVILPVDGGWMAT